MNGAPGSGTGGSSAAAQRPASRPGSTRGALHAAGASVIGSGASAGSSAAANLAAPAISSQGTAPGAAAGAAKPAEGGGDAARGKPQPSAVDAAAAAVLGEGSPMTPQVGIAEARRSSDGAAAGARTTGDGGGNGIASPAAGKHAVPQLPVGHVLKNVKGSSSPGGGDVRSGRRSARGTEGASGRGSGRRPLSSHRSGPGTPSRPRGTTQFVKRARARNITTTSVDLLGEVNTAESGNQTAATKALLTESFKQHFLFASMNEEDHEKTVGAMKREQFPAGVNVIQQNEPGSKFYVLETGKCEVEVDGAVVAELTAGKSFGELALMYDSPRAATIRATTSAVVWSLDRDVFRAILATTASSRMAARCQFLANVPLLKPLSHQQISRVAEAMAVEEFADEAYVIRQGEQGDKFFVIWEGQVSCTKNVTPDGTQQNEVMRLKKGDYFGEMALLTDEPRAANVIAKNGSLKALALGRQDFDQLLGSLRDVLDRQMGIRVLKGVPLLKDLRDAQLERVAEALHRESFPKGTDVIKEGEEGDSFYIIKEGEVAVLKAGEDGAQTELAKLQSGSFFGERALLKSDKRGATVRAVSDEVQCLRLDRGDFSALLGSLESLKSTMEEREKQAEAAAASGAAAGGGGGTGGGLDPSIKFEDLEQLATLGTGTFGRVRLVRHTPTQRVMALKSMSKAHIVATHQQRNIMNEKKCMSEAEHPFILRLHGTFNHDHIIFMLLELVQGGELWSLLYEKVDCVPRTNLGGFETGAAKFYAACVVSGLSHLHDNGWAYRDLKPENLLLDADGFLKVVDFGFAKRVPYTRKGKRVDKTFTLCGTPEYLSPELVGNRGHDKSVDYWAIGILIFELMSGQTPFADDSQSQTFQMILNSQAYLQFPPGFDFTCEDLVRKLLTPNPAKRLGSLRRGHADIRRHRWFRALDWDGLVARAVHPPYKPPIADPLDTSNFDDYPEDDKIAPYKDNGKGYFDGF